MQKKLIAVSFLMISMFLFACHKKAMKENNAAAPREEVKTNPEVIQSPVADTAPVWPVKVDAVADMASTGTPYRVDSLVLAGDVLSVFVNYSGGCKEHTFELVSNGMYAKSMPPQLSLSLKHKDNEDMCKKFVMQELKFNVRDVRYKTGNSVTLKVGDQSVMYTY